MHALRPRSLAFAALLLATSLSATAQLPMTAEDFSDDHTDNLAAVGSGQFDPLTDATVRGHFEDLVDALLVGDLATAGDRIADLDALDVHYELVEITDAGGTLPVFGFRESVANTHPDFRGWGPVLVRPGGALDVVYQAPHPIDDLHSEDIALDAYLEDCCAALAVFSGARRNANGDADLDGEEDSDAAHDPDSLFHAVVAHAAALSAADPALQVQVHGAKNRISEPTFTGSDGADRPPWPPVTAGHPLEAVDAAVDADGHVSMGVCGFAEGPGNDEDGAYLLCATTNVQGDHLESVGQRERFMHFELERAARDDFNAGSGPGFDGIRGLFRAVRAQLGPEIVVDSLTAPATACRGENIAAQTALTVGNLGEVDVTSYFHVGWYLSADEVLGAGDRLLLGGRDQVYTLPAGGTAAVSIGNNIIPWNALLGPQFLLVVVDETDNHAERLEGNNVAGLPIEIVDCP